jgi:hypothetical protein
MAATLATDYEYDPATYVTDAYVIQREVGLWVVEQTRDEDDRAALVLYNSANTNSDETEAISLPDGLKLAWALVRQVASVAIRRAIRRNGAQGHEGGGS